MYQIEKIVLQNIIFNHLIQLVRKYVWYMAYFYFGDDSKLDIYYILKRRYPVI